ncbi:hypothetical protein FAUST_11478 [Fusarium austroamericanum]|uniref:Uncharacterized protein n=1 Tax=Fusarium austroamericanum TaxID=282268 RepID=A0AAN6BUA3_FUSAU|nr:hypothetical protein FAUST_11478 [Fusarium austroamericanum]
MYDVSLPSHSITWVTPAAGSRLHRALTILLLSLISISAGPEWLLESLSIRRARLLSLDTISFLAPCKAGVHGRLAVVTFNRDICDRIYNHDKAQHVPRDQLPDVRDAATPKLTVKDFGATLYPDSWTDFHFSISNPQHVQRWELYRNTISILELDGPNTDHLGDVNYHAMQLLSPDADTRFWTTVAALHSSPELRRAVGMLPALLSDESREPCTTYIASMLMHPQGWYMFCRPFTVPSLLAHFSYRWGVRLGAMCHQCSATYRAFVNGNLEHTLAPYPECMVFKPPPGGQQVGGGSCRNCIRYNPGHECEWAHFTQAKKSLEREGPDSISFAGKNWATENRNAQYFSMGRLNSVDCTVICRVAMGPIVYDTDGRALSIAPTEETQAMQPIAEPIPIQLGSTARCIIHGLTPTPSSQKGTEHSTRVTLAGTHCNAMYT